MLWLISASVIWGFSFGLIKGMTTGIDPFVLGLYRAVVAALVFLPWIRLPKTGNHQGRDLRWAFICGFVQIGLMYGPYLKSFQYLKAYEVALFTMTTPIITALMLRASERPQWKQLVPAIFLATVGGIATAWQDVTSEKWVIGVVLVQASNALFGLGSLLWGRRFSGSTMKPLTTHAALMTPYFAGAAAASGILTLVFNSPFKPLSQQQVLVILWLGMMASGAGFFMWNRGVAIVHTTTLAAANNLKIPLAIVISIAVFGETANLWTLTAGLTFIFLALRLADGKPKTKSHH